MFCMHFIQKFKINANIVHILVEPKFSTFFLCPNHHSQYCSSWSIAAFTVSIINVSELLTIKLLLQSTPHWKFNWIEVLTIRWPIFQVDKPRNMKVLVCYCVKLRLRWWQLRHLTPPRLQKILNQYATIKLLIFMASSSLWTWRILQIDYMANCGMSFLIKGIHSWLSKVLSVKLLSWDQSQDTINRAIYQLLKILAVMIRAHVGRIASTGMYTILALIVNFKWHACKKWTSLLKLVVILSAVSLH